MSTIIDWLLTTDAGIVVLLVGTPALIVAWTLLLSRARAYTEKDHRRHMHRHGCALGRRNAGAR